MNPLLHASLETVAGHCVAVALSGGADSVALALWLAQQAGRPSPSFTLAGLIHINHRLRGAESDRDEAFCRALAERLGLSIDVVHAPVAVSSGRSPEAAARRARYQAFGHAMTTLGATRVVTAHTADDQAETVLMRLLRGSGSRGLSGIRTVHGPYVRPLLKCRRADLRQWLQTNGESWCEDSTNADRTLTRNRIRHDLLPVIEALAPGGVTALARSAQLAEDDESVLEQIATEKTLTVVLSTGAGHATLDRLALVALPPALARRVLRRVCEQLAPDEAWQAEHFDAVCRLAGRDAGGGAIDLPAIQVERVSNVVTLHAPRPVTGSFAYVLGVGDTVRVPEAAVEVSASVETATGEWSDESNMPSGAYVFQVPVHAFPLVIRNRRPGDRVVLSGGTRKVQDLMVDAKIPRLERDRQPLVVAADGRVLWVCERTNHDSVARDGGDRADRNGPDGMVVLRIRKLEHT